MTSRNKIGYKAFGLLLLTIFIIFSYLFHIYEDMQKIKSDFDLCKISVEDKDVVIKNLKDSLRIRKVEIKPEIIKEIIKPKILTKKVIVDTIVALPKVEIDSVL